MSMDLTGIQNQNEYYTNHYLSSVFEQNAADTIKAWREEAKQDENIRAPWSLLRDSARQYYTSRERYNMHSKASAQDGAMIRVLADTYLEALGYPETKPERIELDEDFAVPVYREIKKSSGAPALWVLLSESEEHGASILEQSVFEATDDDDAALNLTDLPNEDLITRIFFAEGEVPRFLLLIGMNYIALLDRNKWGEKRYLQFDLETIFSRREETTLQAMSVLLHRNSLSPEEGKALIDTLDENSQRHAAGVSKDLKYAVRECVELLGNEILYDMEHRLGQAFDPTPKNEKQLTLECLRYMYRMLFTLFIEARPELGFAPLKSPVYMSAYSLESLRDIAENVRGSVEVSGDGFYLHETLKKLFEMIYSGYPKEDKDMQALLKAESVSDVFVVPPLKAHIFDPERTPLVSNAKIRDKVMLQIIDLMSVTREGKGKKARRGRISYANLGINQLGSVYEALLSYSGFVAKEKLYEVKSAKDKFDELSVGYFVGEDRLEDYTEDERVRYDKDDPNGAYKSGDLRTYEKGKFIYRLSGRQREKTASYYTPEVLTKCLVEFTIRDFLSDKRKTADDILNLTICEPAMGSAAFLNELINQLAEAYLDRKQKELGELIPADRRWEELQKVKMYIADRNVYGVDINPVAVELAEVSLWLNTIHEGGFVPWFGMQLVNGDSLIGARRQCYTVGDITTDAKGKQWFELVPKDVPLGTNRVNRKQNGSNDPKQIYHFLLGDPGMAAYSDKVVRSLEPDGIKKITKWKKEFTAPYSESDAETLLRLSDAIDRLWKAQVELRKTVGAETRDRLSVFGQGEEFADSTPMSIRQKDAVLRNLYKTEEAQNAGPYARLKFAMDYWCALWFWPIDKAHLLPSRDEFLFDMSLILEGTVASTGIDKRIRSGQLALFPTEMEEIAQKIIGTYGTHSVVDIPLLLAKYPRLQLVADIASRLHFLHWELEFADIFADRGGFDIMVGNPPWIKKNWNERAVLSDYDPSFAVKKLTAKQTADARAATLEDLEAYHGYLTEYADMAGEQNYMNAFVNYAALKGQHTNSYKGFLVRTTELLSKKGVNAFVHPNGVFDDSMGFELRKLLNPRIRYHFQFRNALKLFEEVDMSRVYGLNVYGQVGSEPCISINNLYTPSTIYESYEAVRNDIVPGLRSEDGNWETRGHSDRIVPIGKPELHLFAQLLDGSDEWSGAHLPVIHSKEDLDVLRCFLKQSKTIGHMENSVVSSLMWNETNAQEDGTIRRNVHFPDAMSGLILSGPHIGLANPFFKSSRAVCTTNSHFDPIDLENLPDEYIHRVNYERACSVEEYLKRMPNTPWGSKFSDSYRIAARRRMDLSGERTLMSAIIPPGAAFIHTVRGFSAQRNLALMAGTFASLPYDFYVRTAGKTDLSLRTLAHLPTLEETPQADAIAARALMLNSLTTAYADLWKQEFKPAFMTGSWSRSDPRLSVHFADLTDTWQRDYALRNAFERRQALVELDVLTAMALGMTLQQLQTIYRIHFPILKSHEDNTWYDANGRIVFTNHYGLPGVGFDRPEWEKNIKGAPAGSTFERTINDDTMPGGPIERTITYTAPFEKCDRAEDYERAWRFFEERYRQTTKT